MTVLNNILNETAYEGEKVGAHAGHTLELFVRYSIPTSLYTICCNTCGVIVLEDLSTRQDALEITDALMDAGAEFDALVKQGLENDSQRHYNDFMEGV
jgi:hypothetical protein|tara:strand:- start:377 stop:670 length:294 start_codon:yes stop_codon:yes gene_type:complete